MLTDKTQLITFLHSAEGGNRSPAYDDKQPWKELEPGDEIIGTLTYGPGFTTREDGTPLQIGDTITDQESFDRLAKYIDEEIEPVLENLIHVPIAPSLANALASLIFNFGASEVSNWRLWGRINSSEEPGAVIREWVNGTFFSKGEPMLGLWRRRTMELLLGFGLDWRAGSNVSWEDQPEDVLNKLGWDGEMPAAGPVHEPVLFDDPELEIPHPAKPKQVFYEYDDALLEEPQPVISDPTPETPITTSDANIMQLEALKKGVKLNISDLRPVIPAKEVTYLTETAKADLQVKRIQDSKRGKGYAKQQTAKEVGVATGLGAAAGMVGAAEPVIQVVDKYPSQTLAYVVVGLAVFAVIYFYYGKWQQQRGEDDATELLG